MIKTGGTGLDRLWFMLRLIHNRKNNISHFNTIHSWLCRLYGTDGLYDVGPQLISDEEFSFFSDELSLAVERHKKLELKKRQEQITMRSQIHG